MSCGKMNYMFGKKKKSGYLPSPDDIANEFGRRTLFGRRYFGAQFPMFGKKKRVRPPPEMGEGENEFGRYLRYGRRTLFGRHRRGTKHRGTKHRGTKRRGTRKGGRKPPAGLRKMCRKYKVKCTKKVGRRRVYKSLTVIKRQLRRKMKSKKKASSKKRHGRKGARKGVRRTRFGYFFYPSKKETAAKVLPPLTYDEKEKLRRLQQLRAKKGIVKHTIDKEIDFVGEMPYYRPFDVYTGPKNKPLSRTEHY